MSGVRKRLSGELVQGARSLILTTPEGDAWIVDTEEVDPSLIGQVVKIEGIATRPGRIRADWVGAA